MLQKTLALVACLLVGLLDARSVRAAPEDCTDLMHCPAVLDLANDLKLKPTKPPGAQPSGPTAPGASPTPTPTPPPVATPSACQAAERRDAAQWTTLKPKVVTASTAIVENSRCPTCKPEDKRALQELWGRSMVRYTRALSCAFETTRDEAQRAALLEELRRVFSGAVVAGAGDSTALLALIQQSKAKGEGSLSEIVELSERLQDPVTRRAFIQRLDALGGAESGLSQELGRVGTGDRLQQDLLDVLLKAERTSLAMGMSLVTEPERRARLVRGVRGVQLVVEKGWHANEPASSPLETGALDYVQGLKELLTLLTTEGIRKEQVAFGDARNEICSCVTDNNCRAVLLVHLTVSGAQVQPSGELLFREALKEQCRGTSAPSSPKERVVGQVFGIECAASRTRAECADDRVQAAAQLMNLLSYKFSVFGDIAFLTVDRHVEAISATFHPGVSIDDMALPVPTRAPRLLREGLAVETAGCARALRDQLVQRLRWSYGKLIGDPIGDAGGAHLGLSSSRANTCTARLLDRNKVLAYGLTVRFDDARNARDAGEDAGRTIGQFYHYLQQAQILAERRRDLLPASKPPAVSSFLVAGAPFLLDDDEHNNGFGWLYTSVDIAGLTCGATFAILSVNARNHAQTGTDAPFKAAQTFLGATYGCLAASAAARIGSMIHYAVSAP